MIKGKLESTCIGESCHFWALDNDDRIICPLYIQTVWREEGKHQPTVINDCAPKRNTLLLMDYSERAIGIQQDYEHQRNMYSEVLKGVGEIVTGIQERNKMLEKHIGIEHKEDPKLIFEDDK